MVNVAGAPYNGLAKEREGAPSFLPRCSRPFLIIFFGHAHLRIERVIFGHHNAR
jgi:hypothetical protein